MRVLPFVLILSWVGAAAAQPSQTLQELLRPGSRPDVGLGGDPFLSELRDETGWWDDVRPAGRRWLQGESSAAVPLAASSTGSRGNLAASEFSLKAGRVFRLRGRQLTTQVRAVNPRWSRSWQGSSSGFTTQGSVARLELGFRLTDVLPHTTFQAVIPVVESVPLPRQSLQFGIRYDWRSRVRVQGSWRRKQLPDLLQFDVQGEPLDLSMNLGSETRRLDAIVELPGRLSVEGSVQQLLIEELQPIDKALVYHATPRGQLDGHELSFAWGNPEGVRAMWRYVHQSVGGNINTAWGGQRFGKLNYLRGAQHSRLFAVSLPVARRTRLLAEFEDVDTHARARGELETWPFTDTVVDLLGHRRIGKGWLAMSWQRWHLGIDTAIGSRGRWQCSLSLFDVRTDAELDTWRPAFLVFGRADERRDRLSLEAAQLLAVSVGSQWRLAGMDLAVALEQFLPVSNRQRAENAAGLPAPPVMPGDPAPSQRPAWPSGTLLEFSLSRAF